MIKTVVNCASILLFVGLLFVALFPYADTSNEKNMESDLTKRKAAEELALYSQSIVKDYLYISQDLNSIMAGEEIIRHRKKMNENFTYLSQVIHDSELRKILRFLMFTREQLNETLEQPYSESNASLALDMSDVILEGAESIISHLYGDENTERQMLDVIEYQRYLIERMTKFYIASLAGFQDFNIINQVKKAVEEYEDGLNIIEAYRYPDELQEDVAKLRKRWEMTKRFYVNVEKGELPRTVFYSTAVMERILKKLARYQYKLEQF